MKAICGLAGKSFCIVTGIPARLLVLRDSMRRRARISKAKKKTPRLEIQIRGALQLPKHIRENIRHPLLRLGWLAEINDSAMLARWR